MTTRDGWLQRRRAEAWNYGVRLREDLITRYMADRKLRDRPLLKTVIDELIEDVQDARLLTAALPLDRFAQTEVVRGRMTVSINSRIAEMPRVKDAAGIEYLSKWHESAHIARDFADGGPDGAHAQPSLPGFDAEPPGLIVCRSIGTDDWQDAGREFFAENAALAAAVAPQDLARCTAFYLLQVRARAGGDLGAPGWKLLYKTASFIGINPSALRRYLEHRGFLYVVEQRGRQQLMATQQLFRGLEWLGPSSVPTRSSA